MTKRRFGSVIVLSAIVHFIVVLVLIFSGASSPVTHRSALATAINPLRGSTRHMLIAVDLIDDRAAAQETTMKTPRVARNDASSPVGRSVPALPRVSTPQLTTPRHRSVVRPQAQEPQEMKTVQTDGNHAELRDSINSQELLGLQSARNSIDDWSGNGFPSTAVTAQSPDSDLFPSVESLGLRQWADPTGNILPDFLWSAASPSGEVLLRLGIGAEGKAAQVVLVAGSGDRSLDQAFVSAATTAEYSPCMLNDGTAVPCAIGYRIKFDLTRRQDNVVSVKICGHVEPTSAAL